MIAQLKTYHMKQVVIEDFGIHAFYYQRRVAIVLYLGQLFAHRSRKVWLPEIEIKMRVSTRYPIE